MVPTEALSLAERLRQGIEATGTRAAIVVGGGNHLRGGNLKSAAIERSTADGMGMLATVMNGLALDSCLRHVGVESRVLSAIPVGTLVDVFSRRAALEHLEAGRVVILVGGTGHPYFTTDTTAALRALEIDATLLAKGTKVRGVFSEDPETSDDAEFFPRISFRECLRRRLRIMDAAAFSLCRDNSLPVRVFDMWEEGNLEKVLAGEPVGSLVEPDDDEEEGEE